MMYAIVLGFILILQLAAGITATVFRNSIDEGLTASMNLTVQTQYGVPGREEITKSWDHTQHDLRCCGASGPKDWKTSAWSKNQSTKVVPDSCCDLSGNSVQKGADLFACNTAARLEVKNKHLHSEGCEEALVAWTRANANILIGVAFGLAALLLFGIISACHLSCNSGSGSSSRRGYEYV